MPFDEPILIVDDDEGVCRLLTKSLERDGLRVVTRTSGAAALDWLRQHRAALMLLDLRLNDMRGADILEILAEEGHSVPFIVISGVADVRIAVQLMKEGALDFLPKDAQLLELVAPVVRRCLEHIAQQQRLEEVESRFLQLANTIQSVFWISSPDMTQFYFVSPAYAKIWDRPVQSLYEREDWRRRNGD
jgi:DNA-binding NtrC family response regulator